MNLEAEKTAILLYQNLIPEGWNSNDGVKTFVEESKKIEYSVDLENKAREKGVKIIHPAFVAFIDPMKIKSGDIVIQKHRILVADMFCRTNLQEILEENGIEVLAVAGKDLQGFEVVGLIDCTATNSNEIQRFIRWSGENEILTSICKPMTKDQFLDSIKPQASDPPLNLHQWLKAQEIKAKESKSLTINVGLSEDNGIMEDTKVYVQEHTIFVDGTELSDRKVFENTVDANSGGQSTIKHTKKINVQ